MRLPGVASRFPSAVWFFMFICSALVVRARSATTTVTISNTVKTGGIVRPGINLGGSGNYGSQQLLKSLNYASGGGMPGPDFLGAYPFRRGGSQGNNPW